MAEPLLRQGGWGICLYSRRETKWLNCDVFVALLQLLCSPLKKITALPRRLVQLDVQRIIICYNKQESRAAARKPRDAASVLFC